MLAVACGVILGTHQLGDDVVRQPLGSVSYVLMGLFPAWFGTTVSVHWAPRLTFVLGAMLGVAFEAAPVVDDVRGIGWAATGYCVAALLWFLWRDQRSRPRGPRMVAANGTRWQGSWAEHDARVDMKVGLAITGAVLSLGLVAVGVHHFIMSDVRTFEARAVHAAGVVVELVEDPYEMVVDVDGQQFRFERWYTEDEETELKVGDTLAVLVDGDRATPVGQGQGNPAFILGMAAVTPMVAAAVGTRFCTRWRRRRRLLQEGGPSATVRLLWVDDFEALILPTDETAPALRLNNATGLRQLEHVEDDDEDAALSESGWENADLPISETEIAEFIRLQQTQALDDGLTDVERADRDAIFGPAVDGAEPYLLVGEWRQGSTVAVLRESGDVWFAEVSWGRPFKDRWLIAASDVPSLSARPLDQAVRELPRWALHNAAWLRWVLAGIGAVAGYGLVLLFLWEERFEWLAIVPLAMGVSVPFWFTAWFVRRVSLIEGGLRLHGVFVDQLLRQDRVTAVVPVDETVAVRVKEPDELVSFDAGALALGENSSAAEVAQRLRAVLFSQDGQTESRRGPSPAAVAAALVLAAMIWPLTLWW